MFKYDKRPWGWFLVLFQIKSFWIKLINVSKGHRTSLQMHSHRSEIHLPLLRWWKFNYVFPHEAHRMTTGLYIELAWGNPEESDNYRIEDDYDR
jgi:hypothetical protein